MKLLLGRLSIMFVFLTAVASGSVGGDESSSPWAFNGPRGEGYTIDLIDVQPAPGTPLIAGASVEFTMRVKYTLAIASHGSIVLVFQDEKNRSATRGQVMKKVDKGAGEMILSDKVSIPVDAQELRLFVPLVPEGLTNTKGEVTIRYPVRKPTSADDRWSHS
jgi:hypothetical protein